MIAQVELPMEGLRVVAQLAQAPADLPLEFGTERDELDEFEWAAFEHADRPFVITRHTRSPEPGAVLWAHPDLGREDAISSAAVALGVPQVAAEAWWIEDDQVHQLEEAEYREYQHPRDRLGRWRKVFDAQPSLQDVLKEMGAYEMEHGQEHHPEAYETHPKSGFTVRKRDAPIMRLVTRAPDEYLSHGGKGEFPMVADMAPGPFGMGEQPQGEPRPLEYVFRAVSEEDYQQMIEKGHMQSDQRMNLADEGTVAAVSNPTFYLPGGLASDEHGEHPGRILKIELREEDGWALDRDGYIKTHKPIPMDRITDVSPMIITWKGEVPSSVTGNPIGTTRRHVWWPDPEDDLSPLPVTARWTPRAENLDEQGRYHLFHGTSEKGAAEIRASGMTIRPGLGPGWQVFTTNRDQAERYAQGWAAQGETVVLEFAIPLEDARRYLTTPAEHGAYEFDADSHGLIAALPPRYLVGAGELPMGYEIRPADEGWFSHDTGTFIPRHSGGTDTLQTKQGQGEGLVIYHAGRPVASLTWQETPDAIMLGSAWTAPEHRRKGLFEALLRRVRAKGKPVDAYVWDNRELKRRVLEEAFDPQQPRYPKGHPRAGQWRPKLAAGRGRIGPRGMANDLFYLKERVRAAQSTGSSTWDDERQEWVPLQKRLFSPAELEDVGGEIFKLAMRYSTRRAYEARLIAIREARKAIQDDIWARWEADHAEWRTEREKYPTLATAHEAIGEGPDMVPTDEEEARIRELSLQEVENVQAKARADRDALLGVLKELRPMGGTLRLAEDPISVDLSIVNDLTISNEYADKGTYYRGMQDDIDASMREVQRLLPTDWIEESNAKGAIKFRFTRDRANHGFDTQGTMHMYREMERGVDELLGRGYTFVGYSGPWPVLRSPDGELVWVNWAGEEQGSDKEQHMGGQPTERVEQVVRQPRRGEGAVSVLSVHPSRSGVLMHELAHRFESILGEELKNGYRQLNNATLSFLRQRTLNEESQPLRELVPGSGYRDDEVSTPDDFFDPYVGKQYSGGGQVHGVGYQVTEVLTMGLEYLWWPTFGRNLDKDPRHRDFILGILATQ